MEPKPGLMEGIRVFVRKGCWWLHYWFHPGGALRRCLEPLSSRLERTLSGMGQTGKQRERLEGKRSLEVWAKKGRRKGRACERRVGSGYSTLMPPPLDLIWSMLCHPQTSLGPELLATLGGGGGGDRSNSSICFLSLTQLKARWELVPFLSTWEIEGASGGYPEGSVGGGLDLLEAWWLGSPLASSFSEEHHRPPSDLLLFPYTTVQTLSPPNPKLLSLELLPDPQCSTVLLFPDFWSPAEVPFPPSWPPQRPSTDGPRYSLSAWT